MEKVQVFNIQPVITNEHAISFSNLVNKCGQKQSVDYRNINQVTGNAHKVKWKELFLDADNENDRKVSNTTQTVISEGFRGKGRYLSTSGEARARRSVLKNAYFSENKHDNRPATTGYSRQTNIIISPRLKSFEIQQYNSKQYMSDSADSRDSSNDFDNDNVKERGDIMGDKEKATEIPAVKSDSDDSKDCLIDIKNALKEKVLEKEDADVKCDFNILNSKVSMEPEFSNSVEHIAGPLSKSSSLSNYNITMFSCEKLREDKHLSSTDSDEFDTDLEIEKDFGKNGTIPLYDLNIGRKKYIIECDKWKTPPQQKVLKSLPERSMTLRNRSLGGKALPPICAALKDNLRVERLNLDGVDITDDGIQHVAEMLIDNITITHLNVANNSLGLRGAQVLGHVLVVTENITHLNLSGNKLDDKASWYITSGIGSNESITYLDISYNELGEQAGVLMGSALARNTKLSYLDIRWNKVCGKGAVAIFRGLMLNKNLEVLNISWNGLGYDGAVALSKCLKRNVGLHDLDVSNNRLNWRCAFLLAEGLRSNCTLAKLKIGHNPLTTTGGMDILEAVAIEESAICLLDYTEVPVLGAADLLAATISRRRTFKFIHGGIVPTHDILGQRLGRELNPMLRIIEYLRLLGLRPLELMKSFDKTSSFELPRQDFIDQIKKIGVKLHPYEIDALANSISGKGYNKNVINYRKLSMAVRDVVRDERDRKLREREEWLQIKSYHESILKKGTLDEYISQSESTRLIETTNSLKMKSFQTIGYSLASHNSNRSKPGSVNSSKFQTSVYSPFVTSKAALKSSKPGDKRKILKKMKPTV